MLKSSLSNRSKRPDLKKFMKNRSVEMSLDNVTNYRNSEGLLLYKAIATISWRNPCSGEPCFYEELEDLAAAVMCLNH